MESFAGTQSSRLGERAGRIRIENPSAFSPVYCISGAGYYEEALRLLQAPGPVEVREAACVTRGAPSCTFELSW